MNPLDQQLDRAKRQYKEQEYPGDLAELVDKNKVDLNDARPMYGRSLLLYLTMGLAASLFVGIVIAFVISGNKKPANFADHSLSSTSKESRKTVYKRKIVGLSKPVTVRVTSNELWRKTKSRSGVAKTTVSFWKGTFYKPSLKKSRFWSLPIKKTISKNKSTSQSSSKSSAKPNLRRLKRNKNHLQTRFRFQPLNFQNYRRTP